MLCDRYLLALEEPTVSIFIMVAQKSTSFWIINSVTVNNKSSVKDNLYFFGDDIVWIESVHHLGPCKKYNRYMQIMFHPRDMFLKNVAQIKHKISIYNSVFPGGRGLTTSSYVAYNYTISGHTDLYSIYLLYTQFIYVSIHYNTFIYNIFIYF
jgi:hypothetical protein